MTPTEPTPKATITLQLGSLPSRKTLLLVAGGLICSVALAIGAIIYLRENTAAVGIPGSISQRVSFPLYFPRHTPAGLTLDDNSFTATAQVLSYSYTYDNNKHLIVNIQALSSDISTAQFNPTTQFTTHIGKAYVVDLDERTTAAVVTDKSFILINAPQKIPTDTLTAFINSLRPIR